MPCEIESPATITEIVFLVEGEVVVLRNRNHLGLPTCMEQHSYRPRRRRSSRTDP